MWCYKQCPIVSEVFRSERIIPTYKRLVADLWQIAHLKYCSWDWFVFYKKNFEYTNLISILTSSGGWKAVPLFTSLHRFLSVFFVQRIPLCWNEGPRSFQRNNDSGNTWRRLNIFSPEPLGPFHQTWHKAHLSEGDSKLFTKLKFVHIVVCKLFPEPLTKFNQNCHKASFD